VGWIIIIFIGIVVLLFILNASSSRRGKKHASPRAMAVMPPMRSSKEIEIRRSLDLAYTTKQRLTMKYETGHPPPGDPAIKTRDIDIYGIGDEYLEAYCHYRHEVRIFRISRVLWARLSGEAYGVPRAYTPSTWVTEGWGDLGDTRLESIEVVTTEEPRSYISEDTEDKDERTKRERVSGEAISYGGGREGTRTYARYDWQKRFEESIKTPFPDEWSPALPYLYEANRLEREGANQQKIQEVLEQARKADSNATSFYIARWSIIKKMQHQNHE